MDPEVADAFERVKEVLKQNGCKLIEVDLSEIEKADKELGLGIVFWELRECMVSYLNEYKIDMSFDQLVAKIASPDVKSIFETYVLENAPQGVSRQTYEHLVNEVRPKLIEAYKRFFSSTEIDLLAFPGLVCLTPKFDKIDSMNTVNRMVKSNSSTSNAGTPSITIPVAKTDKNLRIGLHLEANFNQDQYLLKCGALISKLF